MALSSEEAFEPEYSNCPIHGRFQRSFLHEGHVRSLPGCPICARERQVRMILDRAAIPARFKDSELSNYVAELPGQQFALTVANDYANNFAERKKAGTCLVFGGRPGTGKTHLAIGIANHVMRNGYTALFATAIDVIRGVRATWRKGADKTEEQVLDGLGKVDLLILDEVGAQHGTDSEQVILFDVINRRYGNLLPTIVITNQDIEGLKSYLGDRAFDRLREGGGRFVVFDWESYRRSAA